MSWYVAQSAVAVKYTDCFSVEEWDFHNECPVYVAQSAVAVEYTDCIYAEE